ncbi:MAG: hypothetical protein ACT4PZ_05185 [Panacagrimonas sp.]
MAGKQSATTGRVLGGAAAILMGLVSLPAGAQLEAFPYVAATVEHDDNVFRTRDEDEALALVGDREQQDTLTKYAAGIEAKYALGLQRFVFDGEARTFKYDRFEGLDHDGHKVSAGMDWQLGSTLKGDLKVVDTRQIQDFSNVSSGTRFGFQDFTAAGLSANLRVLGDYELRTRLGGDRLRHTLDSSRFEDRDEYKGALGFVYLGQGQSSIGLEVEYSEGEYIERDGLPLERREGLTLEFDQTVYQAVMVWQPSDLSRLEAQLGVTDRTNEGTNVDDFSGATGGLSYQRNFSPKTNIRVGVQRRTYSVDQQNQNFVVLTGGDIAFNWAPTPKFLVSSSLFFNEADFEDEFGREDDQRSFNLKLAYVPVDWLVLTPALTWEERTSNLDGRVFDGVEVIEDYDNFRVSLEVRLRFPIR